MRYHCEHHGTFIHHKILELQSLCYLQHPLLFRCLTGTSTSEYQQVTWKKTYDDQHNFRHPEFRYCLDFTIIWSYKEWTYGVSQQRNKICFWLGMNAIFMGSDSRMAGVAGATPTLPLPHKYFVRLQCNKKWEKVCYRETTEFFWFIGAYSNRNGQSFCKKLGFSFFRAGFRFLNH